MADKETIRKEYETGKYTFKQLADKFNISQGTIKSWSKRDRDNGQPWGKVATKTKNQNKKVATKYKEVSWIDIENEYITDIRKKPCTLESLSKKYSIPFATIENYSCKNKWSEQRQEYKGKVKEKATEKSSELISTDIAKVTARHFKIADVLLNQMEEAIKDPQELYKIVEKLRTGYGPGEFNEKIVTEVMDTLNDKKLVNYVNALTKLQVAQRQSLGIMDADVKEKLEIDKAKINQDDYILESESDGFIEALKGTATEDWKDEDEKV